MNSQRLTQRLSVTGRAAPPPHTLGGDHLVHTEMPAQNLINIWDQSSQRVITVITGSDPAALHLRSVPVKTEPNLFCVEAFLLYLLFCISLTFLFCTDHCPLAV